MKVQVLPRSPGCLGAVSSPAFLKICADITEQLWGKMGTCSGRYSMFVVFVVVFLKSGPRKSDCPSCVN